MSFFFRLSFALFSTFCRAFCGTACFLNEGSDIHYLLLLKNTKIFIHSLVLTQFCQSVVHLSCSVETKKLNGSIMYM